MLLRNEAQGARREPSPALRARIMAELESGRMTGATKDAALARPTGRRAWRGRVQDLLVAALVLFAIGAWGFAFLREVPSGTRVPTSSNANLATGLFAPGEAGSLAGAVAPQALSQLARATPGSLRTAIDGSLLAELGNIASDATRAAHFLVGRLPAPLVTRAAEDSPH
jgi:hypothetical protein